MHGHTAPFVHCGGQNARLGGWWFDTQAFSASGADVDGAQLARLDTLHDGLAGNAVAEGGFQHGEPAVGSVVDEQVADFGAEPDPQGGAGVSCSPPMNPSLSHRCKVEGARASSLAASVHLAGRAILAALARLLPAASSTNCA